jgi:phenylpropionate dioxygenase-like ring-hydroxylating dioxygenase large terminal subunit
MMTSSFPSLRDYWYPVTLSATVAGKPVPATLLDEQIVLWRNKDGVSAFRDLCVHRGTRLSVGWVENDQLICPYHGWSYACSGEVVRIPAAPPDRPLPRKARAIRYKCKERYGLVFVCLGEPKCDIYEVPNFEREEFKTHIVGPTQWQANAVRSFENFMDESHLPWVHNGLLGNRDNVPIIPSRSTRPTERGFYYECTSEVRKRVGDGKVTANRLTFDIVLPYSLYHENIMPNGDRHIDLFYVTPVSEKVSVRFMVVGRNHDLDEPAEKFRDFTLAVWEQDRVIVESQRPEEIPVEWTEELHVRGPDDPSVVYRRMLLQAGIVA